MDIFNQIGKKIKDTSQDVAQKTKEMVEINDLNSKIKLAQKDIDHCFKMMGKIYFDEHKDAPEAAYKDLVKQVISYQKEIEEYNTQIEALKEKETEEEAKEEVLRCPKCNAIIERNQKFCSNCGQKIESVENDENVENVEDE